MRRSIRRSLMMLTSIATLCSIPTTARSEYVLSQISPKLSVSGSLRLRGEFWGWFDDKGPYESNYNFMGSVVRGMVSWKDDAFDVVFEAQNSSLVNLPAESVAPAPKGALGLGAVYFAHNRRRNDTNIFLKQAYITLKKVGVEGLMLKGGRFDFSEGNEVLSKDPTLDWLKNARLSQRLIGSFPFSHVGRAYDGTHIGFTRGPVNLTLMASHPTQGGFDLAGMKEMDEIDLLYGAVNLTKPAFAQFMDARFFYIYYGDGRRLLKSDNRPAPVRTADKQDISIHTEGAHWIAALPTAIGTIDLLAWGALQQGQWGTLDHSAWAWSTEMGWQPNVYLKPWLRIGYSRSSGDDTPGDGDHDTFFQILPTARLYSYSTFYNLMNNDDAFIQLLLRPFPGVVTRSEFHFIRLGEGKDLWYSGSGATLSDRNVGFGYPGRPAFGHRNLMQVWENSINYDWNAHLSLAAYYGHVFGKRVVRSLYPDADANYAFLEVTFKL
jgi:Alginate export